MIEKQIEYLSNSNHFLKTGNQKLKRFSSMSILRSRVCKEAYKTQSPSFNTSNKTKQSMEYHFPIKPML